MRRQRHTSCAAPERRTRSASICIMGCVSLASSFQTSRTAHATLPSELPALPTTMPVFLRKPENDGRMEVVQGVGLSTRSWYSLLARLSMFSSS
jgi:hypothetical protein